MAKVLITSPIDDESMERKLISLAYKQAEDQMMAGTASSQIVTHFLKLASQENEVKLEKLKLENQLLEEKIIAEQSGAAMTEMVEEVLEALKSYSYSPPGGSDVELY